MRAHLLPLLIALASASALLAQDGYPRRFRLDFGFAGGRVAHDTEGSSVDGDTDGGFARVRFEGLSRAGFGGGLRFESWASDDDLFFDEGFAAQEARAGAIFGHFTYRIGHDRFLMPIRVGLMLHNYELEDVASGATTLEVDSIGPRFEVAPEFVFNRGRAVEVSAYGEVGFGAAYSSAKVLGLNTDFDSSSVFWGAEIGARVRYEFIELGLALVTQGLVMAESETENGNFVRSFGAGFSGLMLTGAIVF